MQTRDTDIQITKIFRELDNQENQDTQINKILKRYKTTKTYRFPRSTRSPREQKMQEDLNVPTKKLVPDLWWSGHSCPPDT
jgi:hypothetical protein